MSRKVNHGTESCWCANRRYQLPDEAVPPDVRKDDFLPPLETVSSDTELVGWFEVLFSDHSEIIKEVITV